MLLIGIDEAGYGPRLGPLCHGYTAFRCPESEDGTPPDLWKLLRPVVRRHPGHKNSVIVDDSKKVYAAGVGLERLALGISTFLHCMESSAASGASLPALFERLLPEGDRLRLAEDEWGRDHDCGLPTSDCGMDTGHFARLREKLQTRNLQILALGARALSARHYNTALESNANKADVNWDTISQLLSALVALAAPGESVYAVIDRQGGRKFYNGHLSELFVGAMSWVELETPHKSIYKVDWNGATFRVVFLVDAETHVFPVALGSMAAKLARELCMNRLNAYFRTHAPELKPTAGYYGDAGRFLRETRELREKLAIPDSAFVRMK